jgi:hypothetical protein
MKLLSLYLVALPLCIAVGDTIDCLYSVDGIQYDLTGYHGFEGMGADVNEPENAWKVTSLCGKNQITTCALGGNVQALTTWWAPHNGDLQCFTPASIFQDPIEGRPLDEHLAVRDGSQNVTKGFQMWVPNGQLCNKDGVTSGSIVNVLCDETDSGRVDGRFGDELDGGTCWAVIDVHTKAGCSDVPAPPEPKQPIGQWTGEIECTKNCLFKPKNYPSKATFTMNVDQCPEKVDWDDGNFAVDGWDFVFNLAFLDINYCKAARFDATLYEPGEGIAGELHLDDMDSDTLDFSGTFVAYTSADYNMRHIEYKASGKFTQV